LTKNSRRKKDIARFAAIWSAGKDAQHYEEMGVAEFHLREGLKGEITIATAHLAGKIRD